MPLEFWVIVFVVLGALALGVNTVVQDLRTANDAKPTTLHVTHCWEHHTGNGDDRFCDIRWTLPDGSQGKGSIKEWDVDLKPGSTIHGWATPTQAWTERPTSPWHWAVWPLVLIVGVMGTMVMLSRIRARRRRGGTLPPEAARQP
jgi:hypothetical protein